MKQIHLDGPTDLQHPVVTVGTFDGVHRGHQSVLERVTQEAATRGCPSVVVTFDPHPRAIISPGSSPSILTSLEEKEWIIGQLGVDLLAVIPFSQELRNWTPEAFVQTYVVDFLNASAVVVGYDHGFGKDRQGNLDTLRVLGDRLGFEVLSVPPTILDQSPISSTRVRKLVETGRMDEVRRMLGSGYPVVGQVVRGEGRGRQLGFPTANVAYAEASKLLPLDGVYAGFVYTPEERGVILNLGIRPTFNGRARTLEAHILDFDGDLYGQPLRLRLAHRIREERRFENERALTDQIESDRKAAREILSNLAKPLGTEVG